MKKSIVFNLLTMQIKKFLVLTKNEKRGNYEISNISIYGCIKRFNR